MRFLRNFLHRVVTRGTLEVVSATGPPFVVGDGTGEAVAVQFIDRAAERRLLLNPTLALGELYMDGRLAITRGSIYSLLALVASNLSWQFPPGLARAREQFAKRYDRFIRGTQSGAPRTTLPIITISTAASMIFFWTRTGSTPVPTLSTPPSLSRTPNSPRHATSPRNFSLRKGIVFSTSDVAGAGLLSISPAVAAHALPA